jgi:DNA-binding HxlR family transcriptional regulator
MRPKKLLRQLAEGPGRHGRLLRALSGITQKILTQRLRELESQGLLQRRAFLEGRVKVVEYSLTEWGIEVMQIVARMHEWAMVNRESLSRSQH